MYTFANSRTRILQVGQNQLGQLPLVLNALQRACLALPGQDVAYRTGRVTPQQIMTGRQSYINAILIQRGGVVQEEACLQCRRRGFTPFSECRRIPGHFGGACGNCKWRDHAASCTCNDANQPADDSSSESDSSDDDNDEPIVPMGNMPGVEVRVVPYGSAHNPIVL